MKSYSELQAITELANQKLAEEAEQAGNPCRPVATLGYVRVIVEASEQIEAEHQATREIGRPAGRPE